MTTSLVDHPSGGYRFLPGSATFSEGVVALPGFAIVHATLREPLPYPQGFALAQRHLNSLGRPLAALCSAELRVSQPFTFADFAEFNKGYIELLDANELRIAGYGPLARTTVAPEPAVAAPAAPALYGFAYTIPSTGRNPRQTFVGAGMGDMAGNTRDSIIRVGEHSVEALHAKATYVLTAITQQLTSLGVSWNDADQTALYTVHSPHPLLEAIVLQPMGRTAVHGVHWFYSRPPIVEVEFEMDVRGVISDLRL